MYSGFARCKRGCICVVSQAQNRLPKNAINIVVNGLLLTGLLTENMALVLGVLRDKQGKLAISISMRNRADYDNNAVERMELL